MRFIILMIKLANRAGVGSGIGKAQAATIALDHGEPEAFLFGGLIGRLDQRRPLIAAAVVARRFFPFNNRSGSYCDDRRLGKEGIHTHFPNKRLKNTFRTETITILTDWVKPNLQLAFILGTRRSDGAEPGASATGVLRSLTLPARPENRYLKTI